MITIDLYKSTNPKKKFMIKYINPNTNRENTTHFGFSGMSDMTQHKDTKRRDNYIKRHSQMNEDWTKSGIYTPGFWSRYLLWQESTIEDSIKFIEKKFKIKINNYIDGGNILNEKHSAYRSMKLSELGLSKPTNEENKGDLLRWKNEKWQNLTALLTDGKFYNCGNKGPNQIKLNLPSVCRPSKKINEKTPILGNNYNTEQIIKAIKIKQKGNRINWNKL